jgi:hypothetical protein
MASDMNIHTDGMHEDMKTYRKTHKKEGSKTHTYT